MGFNCKLTFVLASVLTLLSYNANAEEVPPLNVEENLSAEEKAPTFEQCVVGLKDKARSEGINPQVINAGLDNVKHDANVIKYDRRQPEFSESFASYFNKRVNNWRIEKGRELRKTHQKLLTELQHKYGVPPHYLISFWGLETNFGAYKGKMSIIRSLTTLACDQRRRAFFTEELMLALKLAEKEQLPPEKMLGSWAGAMGHTQFMPSAYLKYAVDGDGDGKVDLWNSVPDALTSAANFLQNLGWKQGFRWGREVALEDNFSYHNSGIDLIKSLKDWGTIGVNRTNGKAMPTSEMEASLLLPSGHKGPAFLVYDNFHVIMRWNRSQFYAIAVGHLADRISGAGKLHKSPAQTPNLSATHLLTLQQKLTTLGFDVGKPDGLMGPATAKGIRDFQHARNMVADGFPHQDVFAALGIELAAKKTDESM